MSKLRALFFDFDGLILDTEIACYAGWCRAFEKHGFAYPLEEYQKIVGTDGSPRSLLEAFVGHPLDWSLIDPDRREHEFAAGRDMEIKPGIRDLLVEAQVLTVKTAVVSSSPHDWVEGHLQRRDLHEFFDTFVCCGDVPRVKPSPDLYLEALHRLGIESNQAVVFEDSYNGTLAAKRAGIFCVAVPNEITRGMDFSHADLVVGSLSELHMKELADRLRSSA